ncbi:MAG: GreA/GreB family elongation factor [Verrucomicrobiae bacterium]|nr:GreA/GreB family elongation factor [Verrucomicrobiae bacterium]
MREQLETLVSAGKIGKQHVDPLMTLLECGFCQHRGWGFGKIRQLDPVFAKLVIDFPDKPGHGMDLTFALGALQAIPKEHILARKAEDLAGLRELAARDHKAVIKLAVQSFGGTATIDQVQSVLVPDVIDSDWKKWWEVARKELKKDGHFEVPLRKTQPLVYQEKVVVLDERLLAEFNAAKGLKARLVVALEVLKSVGDMEAPGPLVAEIIATLNKDISSHQRTQPALALEGVFCRDDLIAAVQCEPEAGQLDANAIWAQVDQAGKVLEDVTAPRHGRALESFKGARPEDWQGALIEGLNEMSAKLCGEAVKLLVQEGLFDAVKEHLQRLISQHGASTELLLWLAKERSDLYADVLGPEVFRAMLTAIERDQFNEKKSSRLQDFVMDDGDLLPDLIQSADIEVVKDLTRALQFSSGFDDVDRRSLLARIVKLFPAVQSLISGDSGARHEKALYVSWPSLERRKSEYQELVEKKIPANSHDIAVARSYGDLRENAEYKAAKEMHRLLMQRKAELEQDLGRAQGTDFQGVPTSAAGMGTTVEVTELGTGQKLIFHILGAWDFDADRHIISYLSPIAQALVGKKVGGETAFELDGQKANYRIERIVPCEMAPPGQTLETEMPVAPEVTPEASPEPRETPGVEAVAAEASEPVVATPSLEPVASGDPLAAPAAEPPAAPVEQKPEPPAAS